MKYKADSHNERCNANNIDHFCDALFRVQQASERARPRTKHFKQIHRIIFHKVQNFLSAGCFQGYPVVQLEDIQGHYILCHVIILHNVPEEGRLAEICWNAYLNNLFYTVHYFKLFDKIYLHFAKQI